MLTSAVNICSYHGNARVNICSYHGNTHVNICSYHGVIFCYLIRSMFDLPSLCSLSMNLFLILIPQSYLWPMLAIFSSLALHFIFNSQSKSISFTLPYLRPPLSSSSPSLSLPHCPSQMVASRRRSYRTSTIRPGTGYSGISAVPSPAPSTSTSAWWTTLPTVVSEPIPDGVDWESCNYGNWVPVRGHYTISEFQMFDITANFVTIVKQ